MFRNLYFKSRYGVYLRSEHGVKKFAEMCMGQLVRKVKKKSAFYREMNENMLVEKANLRLRADELYEQPMLNAGEYFSVRRRLWANTFIISAVMVAAVFLNLTAITAFLDDAAGISGSLRWLVAAVMAIVLTGGGLIVTERLIETLIPRRAAPKEELEDTRGPIIILWAFLIIGIELSLLGLSEVRADMLAAARTSTLLYLGFLALIMLLPIIAGAIRWDAMRYIDAYKTTRAHRQIDSRMAQIDSILRQNEEYESNFYKIKSISYWDLLNEFKTYKDIYNDRHDMVEQLNGHFAQSYDAFQTEAYKRYASDIRDISAKSMRKLSMIDKPSGSKLAQVATGKLGPASVKPPVPARAANDGAGGNATHDGELYMSPKPIH